MRAGTSRRAISRPVGLALALVTLGAVACQPAPPPPVITVNTTASGADHTPGDGICEVTPGQGDCTLQAAVDEGNAVPKADLVVPAGQYLDLDLTVTGTLRVNWDSPAAVVLGDSAISVAPGAKLNLEGIESQGWDEPPGGALPIHHPVEIDVAGTLLLRRSTITNFFSEGPGSGAALTVAPGGSALVDISVIGGGTAGVQNNGDLALYRTSVFALVGPSLRTDAAAQSKLRASALSTVDPSIRVFATCTGPSTSLGYNGFERPGCETHPTDTGATGYSFDGPSNRVLVSSSSPVVDAIPIGIADCSTSAVDLYGTPLGTDGNGDGVAGCEIGAVERQP